MAKLATQENPMVGLKDGVLILWQPFHARMDSLCQDPAPELVRPQHNGLEKIQYVIKVSNSQVH